MDRVSLPVLLIRLCGLVLSLCAVSMPAPAQQALTADEFLRQVGTTYSRSKSYSDTGMVETLFIRDSGNWLDRKKFVTAFIRPDHFRFEFSHAGEFNGRKTPEYHHIIWQSGTEVREWSYIHAGVKNVESLRHATAAAGGISSLTSQIIPNLLLPGEVYGPSATQFRSAERIEDAKLEDNTECFRLQGPWPGSEPGTFWIEKRTFLVRRIDFRHTDSDFRTETTITYTPVLNGPVTEQMLEFNPPKTK